jgi:hypothetical protein
MWLVGALEASGDLVEPLTRQRQRGMMNTFLFARITSALRQTANETTPLIKARKGSGAASLVMWPLERTNSNRLVSVEAKNQV